MLKFENTPLSFRPTSGVFCKNISWSELLRTSAISCPLWSSVYECQRVKCDVLCAVMYVRVNCFVVSGYPTLRRYINVCNSDAFSTIYLYHTHSNIWYTCNKTGNTKNTIRILK